MRVTRAQAEANRENVINVASRLFRQHGFDGIGLKDLMKGAGLTQGGFYKQFRSKDDLAAQASRRAMEGMIRRWSTAAANGPDALRSVLDLYLSEGHRGECADGCPLVALGADAARQPAEVRLPFEDGIKAHLAVLQELMPRGETAGSDHRAKAILAMMVGAVTLSRIAVDEQLGREFLESASEAITALLWSDEEPKT